MLRDDYIGRMIRQLGEFVARISGLAAKRDYVAAFDEVGRAWTNLLDVPRELVEVLDGPTLAQMLGDPATLRAAGELLAEEAKLHSMRGDPIHGMQCSKRAFELFLEARAIDPQASDDVAILELARVIPPNEIDARYKR